MKIDPFKTGIFYKYPLYVQTYISKLGYIEITFFKRGCVDKNDDNIHVDGQPFWTSVSGVNNIMHEGYFIIESQTAELNWYGFDTEEEIMVEFFDILLKLK